MMIIDAKRDYAVDEEVLNIMAKLKDLYEKPTFCAEKRDFLIGKLIYALEHNAFSDVIGLKTKYVVSGVLPTYIFDLMLLCSKAEQKRVMLHNGKNYITEEGEGIEIKDTENELYINEIEGVKDIMIGKIISEYEKTGVMY